MKIKVPSLYLLFFAFTILFSVSACRKSTPCPDQVADTYNYLTPEQKSKVPYKGNDTLIYTSSTGDSVRCIGQGKSVFFECVQNYSGFTDCLDESKTCFELNNISFFSAPMTSFLVTSLKQTKYNGAVYINFKDIQFGVVPSYITAAHYADTVIINNTVYNVLKLNNDSNFLYYNHMDGVLKCQLRNGKTWRLKK